MSEDAERIDRGRRSLESGAVALEASTKELREGDIVRRTYLGEV